MFIKAADGSYVLASQVYNLAVKRSYPGYAVVCWGTSSGQSTLQWFSGEDAARGALDVLVRSLENDSPVLDSILERLEKIMATQAELTAKLETVSGVLTSIGTEVAKVGTETTQLQKDIADLKVVIASGPVSPELEAAVNKVADQAGAVATAVKAVDDLVPDAPPSP